MLNISSVWVFSGEGSRFSSGVFTDEAKAIEWIEKHKLSGVLTRYPVNVGVYEWAISHNLFEPKREHESSSEFIQRFTSASQEHYHFEEGRLD